MAKLKKLLPVIVALIVFIYLFMVETPSTRLFEQPPKDAEQQAPAFFMTDFVSVHYDEAGKVSRRVTGVRADHYQPAGKASNKDFTLVEQLRAEIYNPDQAPWIIVADRARATNKDDRLELTGNVHLFQQDPVEGTTELFTEKLIYFTKRQVAETDQPVKILSPQGITHGNALNANIKTQTFKLTRGVTGTYETQ
ncbi:LPS export ABC transporter periplasmic protein LptC [Simiduia sp. 21SJ11W-1]|uniref:LPS export ABC transporter periplasmic protein LptC n=1 Tax=Simiduia sp. 21SJ11W-1 TaxID=2909669 RepID=UPI00209D50EC|nr:LPS export ABC transporter periplasmic protein LptC [Simiduia sp. 21SJ11W-1]UTA48821.1 LPS export ABC transporter periplasmic protein LptC [Simiduia sp. 21SJ11W-1]